jgi:hypothetical protein
MIDLSIDTQYGLSKSPINVDSTIGFGLGGDW